MSLSKEERQVLFDRGQAALRAFGYDYAPGDGRYDNFHKRIMKAKGDTAEEVVLNGLFDGTRLGGGSWCTTVTLVAVAMPYPDADYMHLNTRNEYHKYVCPINHAWIDMYFASHPTIMMYMCEWCRLELPNTVDFDNGKLRQLLIEARAEIEELKKNDRTGQLQAIYNHIGQMSRVPNHQRWTP